jgi:uncharacterized repeat protein (TIGR01451 family)
LPRRVARHAQAAVALIIAFSILAALVPAVEADGGLEVTTPFPAVAVAPGSKVSFDITVSSTRSATIGLTVRGTPSGWTASLRGGGNVVDAVTATPDKPAEARLDVDVPADATSGSKTITIEGQGGGATDTLAVTVRVDAAAAGDVSLTTSTPILTGASDASFSFDLQFKNDTPQDVTLSASATGPAGWDVKATLTGETQAASTVVKSGATQNVTVAVKAASDAAAGQYPLSVVATAGDRTAKADLGIEITGSYSADLSTPNNLLSASGTAGAPSTLTFDVTNTGTAPLTEVKLTGTPPSGWKVTFDPESIATIAPNESGTITATVTPSADAVAGDYVVSFQSSASESGADADADIRFTIETSPIWALVGIGIIVLILGGLFYVFRTYGRR